MQMTSVLRLCVQGVLSFTPVTLVFRDLTYAVDLRHHGLKDSERVELLQGVSGYARPGTLTALMGSSGQAGPGLGAPMSPRGLRRG